MNKFDAFLFGLILGFGVCMLILYWGGVFH